MFLSSSSSEMKERDTDLNRAGVAPNVTKTTRRLWQELSPRPCNQVSSWASISIPCVQISLEARSMRQLRTPILKHQVILLITVFKSQHLPICHLHQASGEIPRGRPRRLAYIHQRAAKPTSGSSDTYCYAPRSQMTRNILQ